MTFCKTLCLGTFFLFFLFFLTQATIIYCIIMGHTKNVRGKGKILHRHIGSHGHTPDPRSLLSMQTRLAGFLGCYPLLTPLRTGWPSAWLCPVWQAFDQSGRTSTGPASWTNYHLHGCVLSSRHLTSVRLAYTGPDKLGVWLGSRYPSSAFQWSGLLVSARIPIEPSENIFGAGDHIPSSEFLGQVNTEQFS